MTANKALKQVARWREPARRQPRAKTARFTARKRAPWHGSSCWRCFTLRAATA